MIVLAEENDLAKEWRARPSWEKAKIIADFLVECGQDTGWEEWLEFLQERFAIIDCIEIVEELSGGVG